MQPLNHWHSIVPLANTVPVVLCHLALMKFYAATLKCIIYRSNIQGENLRRARVFRKEQEKQSFLFGKVIQKHPLKLWPKHAQNERIDQSKEKFAIVLKKNQMGGNLKVLDLS